MKLLWQIFIAFLKISPVTFGGGYAMIPLIEREIVEKRGWVSTEEIANIFAVAESVPGAIAINSATLIGYRLAGVRGAIAAMLGTLLPAFIIVVLLSIFVLQVKDHPKTEAAFTAVRSTVVALITYAAVKIGKTAIVDTVTALLAGAAIILMWYVHLHPVFLISGGAAAGIAIVQLRKLLGLRNRLERDDDTHYKYPDYFFGEGI